MGGGSNKQETQASLNFLITTGMPVAGGYHAADSTPAKLPDLSSI